MKPLLSLLLLAAGCTPEPASIEVQEPLLVDDAGPQSLSARVLDADGQPVEGLTVSLAGVEDEALVELGKDGRFRCLASGVTRARLAGGPLERGVELVCDLVKEVRALPAELSHVLVPGEGGAPKPVTLEPLRVEVVDHDDRVTTALPLSARSSDEAVVRVGPDRAPELVGPGEARLVFTAGRASAEVKVSVGLEVLAEAGFTVAPREDRGFPLPPGRYLATAGSDEPVSLSFAGTDCESERSAAPRLECSLDKTATVVVGNHPGLSFGKDARVTLRVVKLP